MSTDNKKSQSIVVSREFLFKYLAAVAAAVVVVSSVVRLVPVVHELGRNGVNNKNWRQEEEEEEEEEEGKIKKHNSRRLP